jgi:hypothetical protein
MCGGMAAGRRIGPVGAMIGTLPLQPGCVRVMLIRYPGTFRIVDIEVFFDGDEAERARDNLDARLIGEFRDYRPDGRVQGGTED